MNRSPKTNDQSLYMFSKSEVLAQARSLFQNDPPAQRLGFHPTARHAAELRYRRLPAAALR